MSVICAKRNGRICAVIVPVIASVATVNARNVLLMFIFVTKSLAVKQKLYAKKVKTLVSTCKITHYLRNKELLFDSFTDAASQMAFPPFPVVCGQKNITNCITDVCDNLAQKRNFMFFRALQVVEKRSDVV